MEFQAIYENGAFQPIGPVSLPEHTPVTVVPAVKIGETTEGDASIGCNSPELYALLNERYDSGDREGAARHNEHQP